MGCALYSKNRHMKRNPKTAIPETPVSIPAEIRAAEIIVPDLAQGMRVASDRTKPAVRCTVCGADANPGATEQLCWVCRRLKISAWRDVEQPVPAQE
jgi:hypothetical protein